MDSLAPSLMNNIGLYHQVFVNKLGRKLGIGLDSPHLSEGTMTSPPYG